MVNVVIAKNFNMVDEDIQVSMLQVGFMPMKIVDDADFLVDAGPKAGYRGWHSLRTPGFSLCAPGSARVRSARIASEVTSCQ